MIIVGIDEVGRGPLAGPVTVGMVCCERKTYTTLKKNKNLPLSGKDSKKLKPEDREKYSDILKKFSKEGKIAYAVIHISNKTVDSKGISYAIRSAISKGIGKLKIDPENSEVLLDGGLRLPKEFIKQKTIIKGDEKEKIIAWASILAKVSRDSLMRKASRKYPEYDFASHKGYGTKNHLLVIKKQGLSIFHRKTFCKNIRG